MMKVPTNLRTTYQQQIELNEAVRERAEGIIKDFLQPHWHYEGRLKELESFALKIQSGRVPNPAALEDFFACTIVVRNALEIPAAECLVQKHLSVLERRPPEPNKTHKSADAFPFDDLRIYATLKKSELTPATDLDDVKFEIQIKTFLQHAWSIATHDLLYKSSDVRWPKARIAFQIKAMLEHAELAIQEAGPLSTASLVAKTDERTAAVAAIIDEVSKRWPPERLPADLRRLAENIVTAMSFFEAKATEFSPIIDAETAAGRGVKALNLSPYSALIQGLVFAKNNEFQKFLKRSSRRKLAVPQDIEVPSGVVWPPISKNVVVV